jgi:hypothetical protein
MPTPRTVQNTITEEAANLANLPGLDSINLAIKLSNFGEDVANDIFVTAIRLRIIRKTLGNDALDIITSRAMLAATAENEMEYARRIV